MKDNQLIIIILPTGSLELEWQETKQKQNKSQSLIQDEIFHKFSTDQYAGLFHLGFIDKNISLSVSLEYWRNFSIRFIEKLRITPELENSGHNVRIPLAEDECMNFIDQALLLRGAEYLNNSFLNMIWEKLNRVFSTEIQNYQGTLEDYFHEKSPNVHLTGRVFFHLVENKGNSEYPFAFLATYSIGMNSQGKSKHLPLKNALIEYGKNNQKLLDLLATVYRAKEKSTLINDLVETGELFSPNAWSSENAYNFLKEIPTYEDCGILCRIPNWWKSQKAGLRVNITVGEKKPSQVGMDGLLDFNASLMLGDVSISKEEAKQLLDESSGLAFIKGKWVPVDHEKLKSTLDKWEAANKLMEEQDLDLQTALRMLMGTGKLAGLFADNEESVEISSGEWLKSCFRKMQNPELIRSIEPGKLFKAKLRPYQKIGLNWLYFLYSLNFGACLADDMGLGKTVQLLALLEVLRQTEFAGKNKKQPSLLILPASLISNWIIEIDKFAPGLRTYIAHPSANPKGKVDPPTSREMDKLDIVITTYKLIQNYEWLKEISWNYVILDEAQAIKKPTTKQTKVIKKLKSIKRIAMTGTPIENRLSDLWSLFDFLNPGLLGSISEFKLFSKKNSDNPQGFAKIKRLINPYILRRLKTDKNVISDLPDKIEMKSYARLSKKQVVLYQKLVDDLAVTIASLEGIKRRGLILASLMKFKQLCNHPAHYLGNNEYNFNDSGKYDRLKEICETICEKREKVLVFTQFKEITEPLSEFLATIFERTGVILHGGTPVAKRQKLITRFQSNEYVPYFVLSLKAGGVGLNLTAANHVIHFDRWWNPAVENQATDRAFRIGQNKNVVVHKFICQGTIEEKIDNILEEKTKLFNEVIQSSSEDWITNLGNKDIIDMFKLDMKSI